jgi:hypothetical protein
LVNRFPEIGFVFSSSQSSDGVAICIFFDELRETQFSKFWVDSSLNDGEEILLSLSLMG